MSALVSDVRHALRLYRRTPLFTVTALLTLALGLGATTAVFSFVSNVLLKPSAFPEAERIAIVLQRHSSGIPFGITTLDFLDWERDAESFDALAAQVGWSATLVGGDEPVLLPGVRVSAAYFDIFQVEPFLGRTFRPEEDEFGRDDVVLLSHALWENRFGADPGVVGASVELSGRPFTVVGVLPPDSAYDRAPWQVMKPVGFTPAERTRGYHWFASYGRLADGVSIEQARAEMEALAAGYAEAYPEFNGGFGAWVDSYADTRVGSDVRTALYVFLAAALMVLFIGCANLANLLLARGLARGHEVAVRASLGAGRWRLVRQFLTESVLLSVAGGALGLVVAALLMHWMLATTLPFTLPLDADVGLDAGVLAFALVVSVLTGVVFGLVPALGATRRDLAVQMKEGARGQVGGRGHLQGVLIVAEVALAFMLLVGAGLSIRSFANLQDIELGFDETRVLTMSLPTPAGDYADAEALTVYLRELQRAVGALPGVRDTALTTALPLRSAGRLPVQVAGEPLIPFPERVLHRYKTVSPSYFEAVGIELRRGRLLNEQDRAGGPPVVVVNEALARSVFGDADALGRVLRVPEILLDSPDLGDDLEREIVGIVSNEQIVGLTDPGSTAIYAPWDQEPRYNPNLVVRADVEAATLQRAIRDVVDGLNPEQVLGSVQTMARIKADSIVNTEVQTTLLLMFAGAALLLAALGLYGAISYVVSRRTQEIGIRSALGATASNLLWLNLAGGLSRAALGLVVGLGGALALTQAMTSMLYGVGARDPLTMLAVAFALAAVAAAASYVPARRATRINPVDALRFE